MHRITYLRKERKKRVGKREEKVWKSEGKKALEAPREVPRLPTPPQELSGGGFGRVLRLSWGASERSWAGETEEKSEKRRETRAEKRDTR